MSRSIGLCLIRSVGHGREGLVTADAVFLNVIGLTSRRQLPSNNRCHLRAEGISKNLFALLSQQGSIVNDPDSFLWRSVEHQRGIAAR